MHEHDVTSGEVYNPVQIFEEKEIRFAQDLIAALRGITDGKSRLTVDDIIRERQKAMLERRQQLRDTEDFID